jgi:hypothetical protein
MNIMNNMIVTSAKYTSHDGDKNDAINAVIDGKALAVPLDPDNIHYQAILKWVSEGNKIEDAD